MIRICLTPLCSLNILMTILRFNSRNQTLFTKTSLQGIFLLRLMKNRLQGKPTWKQISRTSSFWNSELSDQNLLWILLRLHKIPLMKAGKRIYTIEPTLSRNNQERREGLHLRARCRITRKRSSKSNDSPHSGSSNSSMRRKNSIKVTNNTLFRNLN